MLGYPAKLYDGSWLEWGQMADVAKDGGLAATSPWRTDTPERSGVVTYNVDNGFVVEELTGANSFSLRADGINLTDTATCGGGGDGGGPAAPGY